MSIKLEPKTLNEWTLELNIAHELADMFNTPFGMLYPVRLRNMFDILSIDYRRFTPRKTKIYKLTPAEEGSGGGWDTKLIIPRAFGRDDRIVYFQFKSGVHSEGNTLRGSRFNISITNPNKHIEFSFNDNENPKKGKLATQHDDLKALNDYLIGAGFSNKSVLYAFPRVSSLAHFNKMVEPLILKTTFLSVEQLDSQARSNGINLHNGERHHFRSCYINENKSEVSSQPFELIEDDSLGLLEEIMLVKISRIWNAYLNEINPPRLQDYLIISLAEYLRVNPFEFDESPFYFLEVQAVDFRFEETEGSVSQTSIPYYLFKRVYNFIRQLNRLIDINFEVPSVYTNPLNLDLRGENEREIENVGAINVSSIIF